MISSAFAPGDVVALDFPFSDGVDSKNRPALVLMGPSDLGDYTVAMISRAQQGDGVAIGQADFASGTLKSDSFVRVRHVYTCVSGVFVLKRGSLKPAAMQRVLKVLCPALGCRA